MGFLSNKQEDRFLRPVWPQLPSAVSLDSCVYTANGGACLSLYVRLFLSHSLSAVIGEQAIIQVRVQASNVTPTNTHSKEVTININNGDKSKTDVQHSF